MKNELFKEEAIKQCEKSSYKYRMGAVVVYKNKLVGWGYNKVCCSGSLHYDGRHAEIEALRDSTARFRKGSTVYVCRINKGGNIALAKPCYSCEIKMRKIGVKYVWYSVCGGWERMSI